MVEYFTNGRTSNDEDERSGRLSTSRSEIMIAQVESIIHENRRLTVREVGIYTGSYHTILTEDLEMHRGLSKICTRTLD
jgi:hypothetical protein